MKAKQGFGKFPPLSKLDPSYIRSLNGTPGLNFKESHKAAKEAYNLIHRAQTIVKGLEIWRKLEKVKFSNKYYKF